MGVGCSVAHKPLPLSVGRRVTVITPMVTIFYRQVYLEYLTPIFLQGVRGREGEVNIFNGR